jgi:hypothetical protein
MTTVEAAPAQAGGGAPEKTTPEATQTFQLGEKLRGLIKKEYESLAKDHDLKTLGGFDDFLASVEEEKPAVLDDEAKKTEVDGLKKFESWLTSEKGNAQRPLEPQNLNYSLNNYFISSSHNTYLSGNQLTSDSSTDGYKNVLLRGCRCVEIDIWDGEEPSDDEGEDDPRQEEGTPKKKGLRSRLMGKLKRTASMRISSSSSSKSSTKSSRRSLSISFDKATSSSPPKAAEKTPETPVRARTNSSRAEPRVLHGYTATKEISFRSVCETIRDYAFKTSDLPVIISLEVHTSLQQQEVMVEIMQETWKGMLVEHQDPHDSNLNLPTPEDLRKKLLIKVKYSPPKPRKEPTKVEAKPAAPAETKKEDPSSSSSSSSDDEDPGANAKDGKKPDKPSKILEALSRLGIYTRSYHFGGFDGPEAQVPTHIFSLSEGKLMEIHENQSDKLFKHNKNFLMRTYPKGLRISSSNLDPTISWRKGVQICALNWQKWDEGTMLNEAMFSGSAGYVLKPHGFKSEPQSGDAVQTPIRGRLDLSIKFLGGQKIPLPPDDDNPKGFKPYVKCELHVEKPEDKHVESNAASGKPQEVELKQHTKTAHTPDPDFGGEVIKYENIQAVTPELSFVRYVNPSRCPLRCRRSCNAPPVAEHSSGR